MGIIDWKNGITEAFRKYKYVWIVLLVGILLMLLPSPADKENHNELLATEQENVQENMELRLESLLSEVSGAGQVKVLLSVSQGEQTIYQTDSSYAQGQNDTDTRTQTILITDSQRNETGLIHQINPPKYMGAIILAQGADDPVVKLEIVEAVGKITGLGADRISVLKMQ
jgi:stage III sporulation protein AG